METKEYGMMRDSGYLLEVDTEHFQAVELTLDSQSIRRSVLLTLDEVDELIGQLSQWVEEQPERIEAH